MKKKIIAVAVFSVAALALAGCSKYNYGEQNKNQEQNQNQNQESAQKGNPPAETTSACEGKSEGDSCEIAMPQKDGTSGEKTSGICKKAPKGDGLVCMPNNMPSGERMPDKGNNPQGRGGQQK